MAQAHTQEGPASAAEQAPGTVSAPSRDQSQAPQPVDLWWSHLRELCGRAFAGVVTSRDPADALLADQALRMHVRRCSEDRIEIPFLVGEDRSRTWVLSRTEDGRIHLQHDHRHEDGSPDPVTLYGGISNDKGTESEQHFPADAYSKELFISHGLDPSTENVWTMEILRGERFSYRLRRPGRHFRADFDLRLRIEPPPAPWGH